MDFKLVQLAWWAKIQQEKFTKTSKGEAKETGKKKNNLNE